jgi:hypothetical protein
MTPEQAGFKESLPGHTISQGGPISGWRNGHYWNCSCGELFHVYHNADGKASAGSLRAWRWHLSANTNTTHDEYIPMGAVDMTRTRYEYYIVGRDHVDIDSWVNNDPRHQWKAWATRGHTYYGPYHYAITTLRRPTNAKSTREPVRRIESVARSINEALAHVEKLLSRQEDKGYLVKREDHDMTPPPMHPESSFVDMLDRADKVIKEGNVLEIKTMLEEVGLVLGMVPVLEQKKAELVAAQAAQVQRMLQ